MYYFLILPLLGDFYVLKDTILPKLIFFSSAVTLILNSLTGYIHSDEINCGIGFVRGFGG